MIADPCEHRSIPNTDGLDGLLQSGALTLLDEAACALGTSRERLALDILEGESPPLGNILEGGSPSLWRLPDQLIEP